MQTFLPYPRFAESARALDRKRLGKQRVETMQIMKALLLPDYGWQHHPAVRMWRGYHTALLYYQNAICKEWRWRGYKDTCFEKTRQIYIHNTDRRQSEIAPHWLGNKEFHRSHQSNLIRKDPEHYRGWFPGVPDDLPYIWPEGNLCLSHYETTSTSTLLNPPDPTSLFVEQLESLRWEQHLSTLRSQAA